MTKIHLEKDGDDTKLYTAGLGHNDGCKPIQLDQSAVQRSRLLQQLMEFDADTVQLPITADLFSDWLQLANKKRKRDSEPSFYTIQKLCDMVQVSSAHNIDCSCSKATCIQSQNSCATHHRVSQCIDCTSVHS